VSNCECDEPIVGVDFKCAVCAKPYEQVTTNSPTPEQIAEDIVMKLSRLVSPSTRILLRGMTEPAITEALKSYGDRIRSETIEAALACFTEATPNGWVYVPPGVTMDRIRKLGEIK
jgi:16S rRNA G1207 methylase RsmC